MSRNFFRMLLTLSPVELGWVSLKNNKYIYIYINCEVIDSHSTSLEKRSLS